MLTAQDAAGARSQKQERRSGVLQEEGRMPEHDRKATNMQKIRERAAVAKHTQVCQELNDPQLHQPQQVVSFLDDLVGGDASQSTWRCLPLHANPGLAQTTATLQSRLKHICKR